MDGTSEPETVETLVEVVASPPAEPEPARPGDLFADYRIEAVAGRGGMGVVYRALDLNLQRRVALKLMAPRYTRSAAYRERFREESRAAASLEHPNIIPIYRSGEQDGRLFIAMRFVEGASLRQLIASRGALPLGMTTRILSRVADALDAAHAHGLVHRDVKPGNVLISDPGGDEHVYLTDFGLAVFAEDMALGRRGSSAGTPGYLSPEQTRGLPVDARADVYALGCVLVAALTGRPPDALRAAPDGRATELAPTPPKVSDLVPGLPSGVDGVVARAMAAEPADRFPSAGEFAAALRAARLDVVVVHDPRDAREAGALASRLEQEGLDVRLAAGGAGDDLSATRACLVVVGRAGLGERARPALSAVREIEAVDAEFMLASVLLPGAPDPLDPGMSFLVGRASVDLRADADDPHAVLDLLRILGVARPEVPIARASSGQVCPYRGLEAFGEEDAPFFFGREDATARLLEKMRDGRFLAVLGASGSGKSSLVHAGLVPALLREARPWSICSLTPGAAPTAALAAQLARATGEAARPPGEFLDDPCSLDAAAERMAARSGTDARLLVVVDQFEEVYALDAGPRERRALIDNLIHAATIPGGRTTVVIAMRSDFYAHCAEHRELRALVAEHQFLVGALGPAELRRAVEQPAALAGLTLEPGLVRRIVGDISNDPGALPLLEHLLLELWRRRRGTFLTLEAYEASGGVGGALAKRANEVYQGLDERQQAVTRRVLLRLTQPGENTEDTRRRAPVAELSLSPADEPDVDRVVGAMSAARLLFVGTDEATGAPVVEVTHEALIRSWPELRAWIEEDREQLRLHRRLTDATVEWLGADRDEALLYRGSRLAAWHDRPTDELNDREREFLATSRERAERERAARRRRLRLAFAGLVAGILVLGALSAVALVARNRSRDDARAAHAETARALAAQSRLALGTGTGDAFTLAQRSVAETRSSEGDEALRLAAQKPLRRSIPTGHGRLWAVSALADGRIASGSEDGELQVWDPARPDAPPLAVATRHRSVYVLNELPDGRILTGNDDGRLELRDLRRPDRPIASVATGHGPVYAAALLPDGTVATGSDDGRVEIRHPSRLDRVIVSFPTGHGAVDGMATLPDGRLVTGSDDGRLQVWDPGDPSRPIASVAAAHGAIYAFAMLGPNTMVSGTEDGYLDTWSLEPRVTRIASIRTGRGPAWSLQTLPGGRVAVANDDGSLEIRDPRRVEGAVTIRTSHGPLYKVAVLPGGGVATGSDGGQLEVWDPGHPGRPVLSAPTGHMGVDALAVLPGGRVALASGSGALGVWTLGTPLRRVVATTTEHGKANGLAVLPGGRIATVTADGRLQLWDLSRSLRPLRSVSTGTEPGYDAVALPGGRLAVATGNGRLTIWRGARLDRPVARTVTGHGRIWAIDDLGGGRLVTGSDDGALSIWPAAGPPAARPTIVPTGHGAVFSLAILPGGRIATGSNDGRLQVWSSAAPEQPEVSVDTGHGTLYAIAALPGNGIATGSTDGQIQVWNLSRPEAPTASIATSSGAIAEIAPLPDGRLVTASGNGRLEVRDPTAFLTLAEARTIGAAWPLR